MHTLVQNSRPVPVLYIIDIFLFYRPLQQATTTTQTTTKWEQKSKSSRKRLRKPMWKRLRPLIGAKRRILFLRNSLTIIPGKDTNRMSYEQQENIIISSHRSGKYRVLIQCEPFHGFPSMLKISHYICKGQEFQFSQNQRKKNIIQALKSGGIKKNNKGT